MPKYQTKTTGVSPWIRGISALSADNPFGIESKENPVRKGGDFYLIFLHLQLPF